MDDRLVTLLTHIIEKAALNPGATLEDFKGDKGETPRIVTGRGAPHKVDAQLYLDVITGDIWENK